MQYRSDGLRNPALWLFVIAALVLAAGMGLRDPWPADEPRFALIAKDMVESGDWLIPRVGGVLYPDKPPLFFWFVAAVYAITGSLSIAFLTPTFIAGLAVLWLVHDLARRLWDRQAALWTAAALLATVQFPLQMKSGQIDGFLCLWTTLGLYGLCRHLLLGPDWRWYGIAGFASGLGVITKGVGFLPFLLVVPWLAAQRARWPLPVISGGGRWLLAPAAFAAAVALWLVPMLLATSGSADLLQYRNDILFRQTVTRYSDAWGHIKPFWYLFTNAVPWLWLPLTLLLPWLVPAWSRDLKQRSVATLLLGAWILLVLLFFSLSDGKRGVYIFPAAPALALLAGRHLPAILAHSGARRALFALAALLAVAPLAVGIYTLADPEPLRASLSEPSRAGTLSWASIAIGVLATVPLAVFRVRRAAYAVAGVAACFSLPAPLLVYPLIDSTRSGAAIIAAVEAIDAADPSLRRDGNLGFADWKEQFLLQWNGPAVHFGYRREDPDAESLDAARWLSSDARHRVVLPDALVEPCFDRPQLLELGLAHRQHWFLAAGPAVLPPCRALAGQLSSVVVYYDPSGEDRSAQDVRSATRPRETARSAAR